MVSSLISMDRPSEKQRYYFDLVNGENISFDEEGMELPDIQAALEEAALALAARHCSINIARIL